jgi:hypothetical protein
MGRGAEAKVIQAAGELTKTTKGKIMAVKSKNHRQTESHETRKPLNAMADQARTNYEQAVLTGQKFQEEAGQWWTRMLGQAVNANECQKQFARLATITTSAMPLAQRRLEEAMQFIETNSRTGTELMKKAVDAAQTSSLAESQAKWMDFWSSYVKAAQLNLESATRLSTNAIDSWLEFVRENTELSGARMSKAA